jgi:hypothetical protein
MRGLKAPEAHLFLIVDALIAHYHHRLISDRGVDGVDQCAGGRLMQIRAEDFCAERCG